MFTGHYSVSFAGRATEKRIPLWLLFIAVQWIDVMWSIFVLLGIEKVRIVPGITASNALDLYYMPYTHSLWACCAGRLWHMRFVSSYLAFAASALDWSWLLRCSRTGFLT